MAELTIKIKLAWWVIYIYLPLLVITIKFWRLFIDIEAEPNWDKVDKVIHKAISLRSK